MRYDRWGNIVTDDGRVIPSAEGNKDYDAIIDSGEEILQFEPGDVDPVPQDVALWQAREQIRIAGLFQQVDLAMQQAGGASLAAWEYGTEVRRDANIIQQFKVLLGMTDAQIDQMFVEAAKLKV